MKNLKKGSPPPSDDLLNQAIQLHQSGQLSPAESLYLKILKVSPTNPDALHLLGVLTHQKGSPAQAIPLIQKALEYQPNAPHFHNNLANAFKDAGNYPFAIKHYQLAIQYSPNFEQGYFNMAQVFLQLNQPLPALESFKKAYQINPQSIQTLFAMASIEQQLEHDDEALTFYQKILALAPHHAIAHNNIASLYQNLLQFEKAIQHYQQALKIQPDFQQACFNLAYAYQLNQQDDLALNTYKTLLTQAPQHSGAMLNIGLLLQDLKEFQQAEYYFRQALNIDNDNQFIQLSLAKVLMESHQSKEGIEVFKQCLKTNQNNPLILNNYALALSNSGHLESSIKYFKKALQLLPLNELNRFNLNSIRAFQVHSNLLLKLCAVSTLSNKELFKEFCNYGESYPPLLPKKVLKHNKMTEEQKLKVGYISPDFRNHSAATAFQSLFEHNEGRFELFAYSSTKVEDFKTLDFKRWCDHWIPISTLNDMEVAEKIRNDQIDILVDLSGHTDDNRLLVFAQQPAPIQVTGLGFGRTTGLQEMNYRISDRFISPPKSCQFSSEKILYIPSLLQWKAPEYDIDCSPLPFHKNGYITFGSGNSVFKLNQKVINLWSEVLNHCPKSHLSLKAIEFSDTNILEHYKQLFMEQGIPSERLQFSGKTSAKEHLAFYQTIDIGLDPFPYNGGITLIDKLWMGVPSITLDDGIRSGKSILNQVGLESWVASDSDNYLQLARHFNKNIEEINQLRSTLRKRLLNSPLTQGQTYCNEVGNAYQSMWNQHILHSN